MTTIVVKMKPVTQGSVTAIPVNGRARIIHNHSKDLYIQRELIQSLYADAGGEKYEGAVKMRISFTFIRPKSISAKKRPNMTVKPDLDKLVRAVLDALTHHAYDDDSQVTVIECEKRYSDMESIVITVTEDEGESSYIKI